MLITCILSSPRKEGSRKATLSTYKWEGERERKLMERETNGRFRGLKSKAEGIVIAAVLLSLIGFVIVGGINSQVKVDAYAATSTPAVAGPTREQQVQALIDGLVEQREKDPTFIAETAREMADLQKQREIQAHDDALMIVKTTYDVNLDNLK